VVQTSYHYGIYQKAVFNITLGNLILDSELIVAEIEDEALLCLDIRMKGKGRPADIQLTEQVVMWSRQVITMEFINKHIYDNLTSRRNDNINSSCNFSDRFWLTYLGARNSYPIQQY
jgi:hypothetical protein